MLSGLTDLGLVHLPFKAEPIVCFRGKSGGEEMMFPKGVLPVTGSKLNS